MPQRGNGPHLPSLKDRGEQALLVEALCHSSIYEEAIEPIRVVETHISYVILTGPFAYKIKKAVAFDFLDFTTLAARRFYCEEELRLNRRLAPSIYLDVVAITGTVNAPRIGGTGPVVEYAVKMRQFPADALLSDVLTRGELTREHIDALADLVANFHQHAATSPADGRFGTHATILAPARDNFSTLWPLINETEREHAAPLREWTEQEFNRRKSSFGKRRRERFIRECHGDLHLNNIALVDGTIVVFDGIEFNESMRWIDVMNDLAFLVMDLQDRHRHDLASRLLNRYLERTGDYAGLEVLRFYLTYRALVRAKVVRLREVQASARDERQALDRAWHEYVDLATSYITEQRPTIVIMHGLSGSGKTTVAGTLAELTGAIRIRTDVERKRVSGLEAEANSGSALEAGLYATPVSDSTYRHLAVIARRVVDAGYPVIVDGTFLKRRHRELFRDLALELNVRFAIADLPVDLDTLRERVHRRRRSEHDASEASLEVLEQQRLTAEPLAPDEQLFAVVYDSNKR